MRSYGKGTVFTVLCAFAAFCTGCIKDISSEIPDSGPKITLNGFFNPRVPVVVSITQSANVLDTLGNKYLVNARGYLYENDLLVDSLTYLEALKYHVAAGLFKPRPGNTYRLDIRSAGMDPVTARSPLPDSVAVLPTSLDTLFYPSIGQDTYWLRIRFQDPPAPGDFYHLVLYRNRLHGDGIWRPEALCYESADPVFDALATQGCAGGMCTDNAVTGQHKEILVNTRRRLNAHLNDSVQFLVELRHGSEPYYLYNKSLMIYKNGQSNIFAQPAPIVGNVAGGYGIFAGYAPVTDTVKLH